MNMRRVGVVLDSAAVPMAVKRLRRKAQQDRRWRDLMRHVEDRGEDCEK